MNRHGSSILISVASAVPLVYKICRAEALITVAGVIVSSVERRASCLCISRCMLLWTTLSRMQLVARSVENSQAASLIHGERGEISVATRGTQEATPLASAPASDSVLPASETQVNAVEGGVPASSASSPYGAPAQGFDANLAIRKTEEAGNASSRAEPLADRRDSGGRDLPAVNPAGRTGKNGSAEVLEESVFQHTLSRNSRTVGLKRARIVSSDGRGPSDDPSRRGSAEAQGNIVWSPSRSEATGAAPSSPACSGSRSPCTPKAKSYLLTGISPQSPNGSQEKDSSWTAAPAAPFSAEHLATAQMVKSVSPAGVVRIGGRNRRKRTKYDLAYKQMEELGPFEEEAKSVDLSKVPGSSFALELLRNPQQYSYESWVYGFAWPVGADGRRLLLRKLRGVYWSNPEKWQRILQENNLYRRDLFTLATVQELFKVTHLMGADVWDFLLKCTALTQKCEALASKDIDFADDEEVGSSPSRALNRRGQPSSMDTPMSEDESYSHPDHNSRNDLSYSGVAGRHCGAYEVPEDKDMGRRTRGRPRKAHQSRAFGHEDAAAILTKRTACTSSSAAGGGTGLRGQKMNGAPLSAHPDFGLSPQSARRTFKNRLLSTDEQNPAEGCVELPETELKGSRRLLAALLRSSTQLPDEDCFDPTAPQGGAPPSDAGLRHLDRERMNSTLLKLAAHYTFMAQFMQCCMLVEVQRTLLRLAEELKPIWSSEKDFPESSPNQEAEGRDFTAQACFESLLRSSNIHMQFVQVIVQKLQSRAEQTRARDSAEERSAEPPVRVQFRAILEQLQLLREKGLSGSGNSEAQRAQDLAGEFLQALQALSHRELEGCMNGEPDERVSRCASDLANDFLKALQDLSLGQPERDRNAESERAGRRIYGDERARSPNSPCGDEPVSNGVKSHTAGLKEDGSGCVEVSRGSTPGRDVTSSAT